MPRAIFIMVFRWTSYHTTYTMQSIYINTVYIKSYILWNHAIFVLNTRASIICGYFIRLHYLWIYIIKTMKQKKIKLNIETLDMSTLV